MEKVKIEYEKLTDIELLKLWREYGDEYREFLRQYNLPEDEVNKMIDNEEATKIWNQMIEYAKGCGLHLCYQCNHFVEENAYIYRAEQCIQCAIGNGV